MGENAIRDFLTVNNINFASQVKFENCKFINSLLFDFGIYNFHKELEMLIEYDGIQHFKPTFGDLSFERTKLSDEIKNNYCKNNNIKLLRIPYWEFDNIKEILRSELNRFFLFSEGDIPNDRISSEAV
jgi:hypothetical protein